MITLDIADVIELHKKLINRTGGSHGVKDISLLESALNNPLQTFGYVELYPNDISKIAMLTYSIINNHAMNDGNKRLGVSLMGILCKLNNIKLQYTQKELIQFGLDVAEGKLNKGDIENWIIEHAIKS